MTTSATAMIHWENGMRKPLRNSRQFSPLLTINILWPAVVTLVKPGKPSLTARQKLARGLLTSAPMACQ